MLSDVDEVTASAGAVASNRADLGADNEKVSDPDEGKTEDSESDLDGV